jgi:ABC-type dipeptide/oligopeptide/nickel transport system ATPase component
MIDSEHIGRIPKAVYQEHPLEEYKNNPFIAALPPVYNEKQVAAMLRDKPAFNNEEKYLDGNIRVHAIARLLRSFFQPLKHHLQLEQKLSLMIRQGYVGRNPKTGEYYSHLQNGYERIVTGDLSATLFDDVSSTANTLSLFGCSGCGKSRTLERITKSYPQAIFHPEYNIVQLTYLTLECPIDGDLIEFCLSFFNEVDKVLHTRYSQSHGRKKLGEKRLLSNMCQIANLHSLGVLIIDEIQNLNEAKSGGARKMQNFFVCLVNTIGIPVVKVGTHKARSLFQHAFSTARRTTGIGSLLWDRLPQDQHWSALLKNLWKYQWLQRAEPLTPEIELVMYELTQGVMDIVIKLFALAQMRAIVTRAERITPKLLEQVYMDEFKPVHPMLDALKHNDEKLIEEYSDLIMPEVELNLLTVVQDIEATFPRDEKPIRPAQDKAKKLLSLLSQMDIEDDIAIPMVDKVLADYPEIPLPALINKITEFSNQKPVAKPKQEMRKIQQSDWHTLDTEDLRYIYSAYNKEGKRSLSTKILQFKSENDFEKAVQEILKRTVKNSLRWPQEYIKLICCYVKEVAHPRDKYVGFSCDSIKSWKHRIQVSLKDHYISFNSNVN